LVDHPAVPGADGDPSPALAHRLAEEIVVVLVQPQHPGNVGAAARAMKNFGLYSLTVVDPPPSFDLERARWMAPGAGEVLDRARIVASLDDALEGVHRAVATTARHRKHGQAVHEPRPLARQALTAPEGRRLAILFGREDTGLTNAQTERCESLLRIPTDVHASLNLGAAVLLVSHAFFEEARELGLHARGRIVEGRTGLRTTADLAPAGRREHLADLSELEPVVLEAVALLQRVAYTRGTSPERVAVTLREALQRAGLTHRHARAVRGMIRKIEFALDHPERDWRHSPRQAAVRAALGADEDAPPTAHDAAAEAPGEED
jgi:TrmH family RNA methyltransferase